MIELGHGDLSINQGQGFKPINSRVEANVGDSIMVGPGGAGTVVYGDGCKVDVQPGAVTTIAPLSPCASGSYAQDTHCGAQDVLVDQNERPILDASGHPVPCGADWGA